MLLVELSLKCQFSPRWFWSVIQPIEAKMKASPPAPRGLWDGGMYIMITNRN